MELMVCWFIDLYFMHHPNRNLWEKTWQAMEFIEWAVDSMAIMIESHGLIGKYAD